MAHKRKHDAIPTEIEEPVDPSDELLFLCLGGGNEVGRSCHIIKYKGKTVMLDAGIHPAYDGLAALPFYDAFDLSTVDILLVTHFHMDHIASLPYVLAKTNFRGKIYMTLPTKQIAQWMLRDAVRVQNMNTTSEFSSQLYDEKDITEHFPRIETVTFNRTYTHSAVRLTPYPAGHVLGAAMFLIEIAGLKVLFTGDYSRELDRHLIPASVPRGIKIDLLITESTFGVSSFAPRVERETALMQTLTGVLDRGGRALLPVFATGHVQEIMLILEEYWNQHPQYRKYPIYYASGLAKRCMQVYQTSLDSMNDNIKSKFEQSLVQAANGNKKGGKANGPWDFEYIRSLKSLERFEDLGGCVMLASPGMMQNGVSRALLERWAPESKNAVIVTGYSVEGTMTNMLLQEPTSIPSVTANRGGTGRIQGIGTTQADKPEIPRRCTVSKHDFAAHVDGTQNREFIEEVAAPVVILVHGSKVLMMRLKSKLLSLNVNKAVPVKVYSPANCEELRIPFRRDKIAQVVGRLASQIQMPTPLPSDGDDNDDETATVNKKAKSDAQNQTMSGVLVQKDFKLSLMAPEDLKEYAGLTTTTVQCRQRLTLSYAGVDLIAWALQGTFGSIETLSPSPNEHKVDDVDEAANAETIFRVMGAVNVKLQPQGQVEVEWEGNLANDGIADAVLAVLFTVETSPAAAKHSAKTHSHSHMHSDTHTDVHQSTTTNGKSASTTARRNLHANITPQERLSRICMFLEAHFGSDAVSPISRPRMPSLESESQEQKQITQRKDGVAVATNIAPDTGAQVTSAHVVDGSKSDTRINDQGPAQARGEVVKTEGNEEQEMQDAEKAELKRLHDMGIPVPGLKIQIDKATAVVWLEDFEVECASKVLADRIRAVVDRTAEVVAPLWSS